MYYYSTMERLRIELIFLAHETWSRCAEFGDNADGKASVKGLH